jgi:1-deoxy-D-xylulose-5-phosphate synthase
MCIDVSERLRAQGIGVLTIDPRWAKPVHPAIVEQAARSRLVVVVEDGVVTGGVGSAIAEAMREAGITVPMRTIGVPDRFLDHGKRAEVLAECGLTAQDISRGIVETIAQAGDAGEDDADTTQELTPPREAGTSNP